MKTTSLAILIWKNTSRTKNNEAELFVRITVNLKSVNSVLK